jgi:hypothetical protein
LAGTAAQSCGVQGAAKSIFEGSKKLILFTQQILNYSAKLN